MSDNQKEKKKRGVASYVLRPRLPKFGGVGSTSKSSYQWIKSTIRRAKPACPDPNCNGYLELSENEDGQYLICNTCGKGEDVQHHIENAKQNLDTLRKGERDFMLYAVIFAVLFTLLAFYVGNWTTFFGGIAFALAFYFRALAFNYRAWRITTGRLFSADRSVNLWVKEALLEKTE